MSPTAKRSFFDGTGPGSGSPSAVTCEVGGSTHVISMRAISACALKREAETDMAAGARAQEDASDVNAMSFDMQGKSSASLLHYVSAVTPLHTRCVSALNSVSRIKTAVHGSKRGVELLKLKCWNICFFILQL
jgi:hypothetical protein